MTRPLTIAGLAVALFSLASLPGLAPAQDAGTPAADAAVAAEAPADAAPQDAAPADASPAQPAPAQAAAPVGNAEAGRQLTYTCLGCHGIAGYKNVYPTYHVPLIGGQSEVYLTNALNEYRNGTRKHPTMEVQAQSFSDQDIADIAAFLSGLTQ